MWEANYARYLNWLIERGEIFSWSYESKEWQFPVKRGTRFYKCDFEIVDTEGSDPWYVEIKGFLNEKDVTALTRMAKYFPEVVIVLLDKSKYQEIVAEAGHLPFWEK